MLPLGDLEDGVLGVVEVGRLAQDLAYAPHAGEDMVIMTTSMLSS